MATAMATATVIAITTNNARTDALRDSGERGLAQRLAAVSQIVAIALIR